MTALLIATLPLPASALGLAVLTVIALGGPSTGVMISSMSVLTDAGEQLGVAVVVATVVFNLSWAVGEVIGAPTAAAVAQLTSDTVALLIMSAAILATLVIVLSTGLLGNTTSASVDASLANRAGADDNDDSPRSRERMPAIGG
jgi:hypothetical protein